MDLVLALLNLVLISVLTYGAVPFCIWLIIALVRRSRRQVKLCVKVLAIFLALYGLNFGASKLYTALYVRSLFDSFSGFGRLIYSYDSERDFNGDGYSLSVHKLPDAIRKRFLNADNSLINEFPKPSSFRRDWQVGPWSQTPVPPAFKPSMDFALGYAGDDELEKHVEAARAALTKQGAFYAFFRKVYDNSVHNIDLYIVDLENDLLYLINFNT